MGFRKGIKLNDDRKTAFRLKSWYTKYKNLFLVTLPDIYVDLVHSDYFCDCEVLNRTTNCHKMTF